jgi:dihydrolipoamide dehydrogenase
MDEMTRTEYDVVIVGGGPAGYSAALRCAQHGLSTVLVERRDVGGTCLNVGCIPSKALIHAADAYHSMQGTQLGRMGIAVGDRHLDIAATMQWKDDIVLRLRRGIEGLLERGQIELIRADAEIIDAQTIRTNAAGRETTITTRSLVLATGSTPVEVPQLPFGGRVWSSTDALAIRELPEQLVVVGAGYIGLELGTAFRKLGAEVTIVEVGERVMPLFDTSLVRPVARRLDELGVVVHTGAAAVGMTDRTILVEDSRGNRRELPTDAALVTVGRRPALDGLGLQRLQVQLAGRAIAIDSQCRTSAPGVYAIGDVTGEPMLAHRGIAQGNLVADVLAGIDRHWDHRSMPAVCFTDPEIFAVGRLPNAECSADDKRETVTGTAQFRANGRALTLGDEDGFIRVVADAISGAVLGIQGVGSGVSELASAASYAVEFAVTLGDLEASVIAHPTLSETLSDAALDAIQRASRRPAKAA